MLRHRATLVDLRSLSNVKPSSFSLCDTDCCSVCLWIFGPLPRFREQQMIPRRITIEIVSNAALSTQTRAVVA